MSNDKKRKRSRSRSSDRKREREDRKWQNMQTQLDNLTKIVESLARQTTNKVQENNQKDLTPEQKSDEQLTSKKDGEQNTLPDEVVEIAVSSPTKVQDEEPQKNGSTLGSEVVEILGEDLNVKMDNSVELYAEIKNHWKTWIKEGLSDEVKKNLLKKYLRKRELYIEPPKINLEIVGALAEVTKKRDQHFVQIQEYVESAIIAVGSAISLLLKDPEKEVDKLKLLECLSDTGKLLAETFHQHSAARKAYITPVMKKSW